MKAISSLENRDEGLPEVAFDEKLIAHPNSQRLYHIVQAFRDGKTVEYVNGMTQITPWFLEQLKVVVDFETTIKNANSLDADLLLKAKRFGFSDAQIARLRGTKAKVVRDARWSHNIHPGYSQVDTCAGEFKSETPYFYSSYWSDAKKPNVKDDKTVVILGSGPNRIGQGIEFDYSCVRGVKGFRKEGYRVVMVNSNPETVSTDYDTSNELYFEPLTEESVLEILRMVNPLGFVAQLGGQTPINLAKRLVDGGFKIMGSSLDSMDLAEDRGRFAAICRELDFKIPAHGMAGSLAEAIAVAEKIGYPIICRPSYVLGGRRMEVAETAEELHSYFDRHGSFISDDEPCLMDQFLAGALEVDVDLVRGKDWSIIGGIVEHIEAAGVHSGDSMGVLPPQRLKDETCKRIEDLATRLADRLDTIGHLNLQLAIKQDQVFMLEANPRSSRSVPFVAKATRIPLIDLGVKAMLGYDKAAVKPEQYQWQNTDAVSVKGVVFPFKKFRDADSILGPEMKSTGESMGRGHDYSEALMKGFVSSHVQLPEDGEVFLSLRDKDKEELLPLVQELVRLGYSLTATSGTAKFLYEEGIDCVPVKKVHEGRPNCVDRIRTGKVALVINTTSGRHAVEASFSIRRSCIDYSIPCLTESHAAEAFVLAIRKQQSKEFTVAPLPKMI